MLTPRTKALEALLLILSVASHIAFWHWWCAVHSSGWPALDVFLSVLALAYSIDDVFRQVMLLRAQRVRRDLPTPTHFRVGMVVTKAPSEPWSVLEKTLTGALNQVRLQHEARKPATQGAVTATDTRMYACCSCCCCCCCCCRITRGLMRCGWQMKHPLRTPALGARSTGCRSPPARASLSITGLSGPGAPGARRATWLTSMVSSQFTPWVADDLEGSRDSSS
jgi:hypothetical protein